MGGISNKKLLGQKIGTLDEFLGTHWVIKIINYFKILFRSLYLD